MDPLKHDVQNASGRKIWVPQSSQRCMRTIPCPAAAQNGSDSHDGSGNGRQDPAISDSSVTIAPRVMHRKPHHDLPSKNVQSRRPEQPGQFRSLRQISRVRCHHEHRRECRLPTIDCRQTVSCARTLRRSYWRSLHADRQDPGSAVRRDGHTGPNNRYQPINAFTHQDSPPTDRRPLAHRWRRNSSKRLTGEPIHHNRPQRRQISLRLATILLVLPRPRVLT